MSVSSMLSYFTCGFVYNAADVRKLLLTLQWFTGLLLLHNFYTVILPLNSAYLLFNVPLTFIMVMPNWTAVILNIINKVAMEY